MAEYSTEMLCRVCLQGGQENEFVSLFDTDENNELLRDKYFYCSDIQVSESEMIPANICLTCVDRLLSAYQFKQQCVSSYDTLKKCFTELKMNMTDSESSQKTAGTELITVKQENGEYVQYEIPIEYETGQKWPGARGQKRPTKNQRGRPRKYPNVLGHIATSPYSRKPHSKNLSKDDSQDEAEKSVTDSDSKRNEDYFDDETENLEYEKMDGQSSDPIIQITLNPVDGSIQQTVNTSGDPVASSFKENSKLKNKAQQITLEEIKLENDSCKEDEDVLLKETILANSEPIPEGLLGSQSKEKKKPPKKVYKYDKVHTCDQCGSSFRSNASLQAHIRRHLGIKPFVCNICGYASVLNMELRRHMMRHTGQKPYKCRYCGRFFGDFGSRQKHERLHLGERPYQCNVCGKSFTYSYVLSNHMLTHTGEKKYSCEPCNKKFTKAHHLKYHNRIHHKELYLQQELLREMEKKEMQKFVNSNIEIVRINQNGESQEDQIQIQDVRSVSNIVIKDDFGMVQFNEENLKCEQVKPESGML